MRNARTVGRLGMLAIGVGFGAALAAASIPGLACAQGANFLVEILPSL
jgi:ribose 5-phosphate isomerase RpiB